MSIDLFTHGAYCRTPGGEVEDAGAQAQAVRWLAWNIGGDVGGDPTVWDLCRSRWDAQGLAHFPWQHCHSYEDIRRLMVVASRYGCSAIGMNIEDVVGDRLELGQVAEVLKAWPGEVHMATLPWVQNGQGWGALARCVAALEFFPSEATVIFPGGQYSPAVGQQCVDHAYAEGLTKVTPMFGTYGGDTRAEYGEHYRWCHSLFSANDVGGTPEAWAAWAPPAGACIRPQPSGGAPVPVKPWYEKPYLTGPPVGPDKLPRAVYPPSAGKGTYAGDDALAYKRGISRGGRLKPWAPATWTPLYGDAFALGDGSGNVGKSGVRGFQRQEWPNEPAMHTGNMGDKTYQAMRRALVSDPEAPNYKQPLFDSVAVEQLERALAEFRQGEKVGKWRVAVTDFCQRAEGASTAAWTYSQRRPYTGLGVDPEKAHVNDCSSYVVLAYFWAAKAAGLGVPDPTKYEYDGYGNTWDDLDGHPRVTSGQFLVGDLAHYNGHVTICKRAGDASTSRWSSFGSEPRPDEKTLYYRGDFLKVVRPPLGA